jgi:hypothetical protein
MAGISVPIQSKPWAGGTGIDMPWRATAACPASRCWSVSGGRSASFTAVQAKLKAPTEAATVSQETRRRSASWGAGLTGRSASGIPSSLPVRALRAWLDRWSNSSAVILPVW